LRYPGRYNYFRCRSVVFEVMNLYFLVEGQVELKLYPKWISFLLPDFKRVDSFDEVTTRNYYIFGGFGIPSIIFDHLPSAIEDVNSVHNYNHLVMCIDAEESSVQTRIDEINGFLVDEHILLKNASLTLIVQNRCIETWLLGNRSIFPMGSNAGALADYKSFFNVFKDDPELMGKHPNFNTHAQFHKSYLRELCKSRGIACSGIYPKGCDEESYFDQIKGRIQSAPQHLQTFQGFIQFCESIREQTE
jgi:hypothetical protein